MKINKIAAAYISISAIFLYWLYIFIFHSGTPPDIPSGIGELLFSIVRSKFIVLLVVFFLLYLEGDKIYRLGFTSKGIYRQIGIGILFGVGSWILINIISIPLLNLINPNVAHKGVNMEIYMKDLYSVALWIPVLLFAVFVEELQRIFVLTRFENLFGKYGQYFALLLTSITFGIGHLYQGINPAIGTGLGGLMYALVYLRKRLAWEAVISHAVFNILSLVGGYLMNHK